ncbi:MAG: fatty acid hydroxylase [Rhodobacteraceae bacterium]|nr:fatty acid hydroxylase [Paracoccaceae bacterium]
MQRLQIMARHRAVVAMALCGLAALLWLLTHAPGWVWLTVPIGILAQYSNEYTLHRFIFHLPPPKAQWAFDLLYQAHYGHHDFPTKEGLFFVPIWVALPVLALNFSLTLAIVTLLGVPQAGQVALAIVFVGGILTFLSYEWFHMTAHLNLPKTRLERYVTTLHNQHHFRDFARWFHVSPGGEIIDRVMGTAINREALKSQQRAAFIRTLGMRPDDARLVAARARFAGRYALSAAEMDVAARV